jgi:methylenetetrahydrofolate dehydrogenase (NADP+)/methenyltetrahydrofolate cyclohydrolase
MALAPSSSARIIDGRAVAAEITARIARETERLKADAGIVPGLAVVLVGSDPASQVYVAGKGRTAVDLGFHSVQHTLRADASEAELLALVERLNADPAIHGILVQLPLPGHLDKNPIIEAIRPEKDIDGLHPVNVGRLASGIPHAIVPCTPAGCLVLIKRALDRDLAGVNAVVVGRSNLVGKPIAQLLLAENCTVTVAHSRTRDLAAVCRRADILVAAVGRPRMVQGDWIKPGATVIDVGINRIAAPTADDPDKSRLVGDVDFDAAIQVAGGITPVPGGVGPMTIACLLANTVTAACRQRGIVARDW